VQPNSDRADTELLALAEATDRVADVVADPAIEARLRVIAGEVRAMARGGNVLARTRRSV
jgi:hypothetical protein